jgi:hypothetical protein
VKFLLGAQGVGVKCLFVDFPPKKGIFSAQKVIFAGEN